MVALLLASQLAVAETPSEPAPPAEPTTTAAGTATAAATANTPPASGGTESAGSTAPVASTVSSVTDADAQATKERMRRKFRSGQALGTTGALGVPVGIATAYVALVNGDGWPLEPATDLAIAAGVLTAAVSFPLVYAGTYTERSAIVGAGCTPRGQALRHAPLALLALGAGIGMGIPALGSPPENIEDVGVDVAAVSWLTAAVQHVFLQADAKDCGLRD